MSIYGRDRPRILNLVQFAQEFLRRNPQYRADYQALMVAGGAPAGNQEAMARDWGLRVPVSPHKPAWVEPAIWSPTAAPTTLTLVGAVPDAPFGFQGADIILADHGLSDGRHILIHDDERPYQLFLPGKVCEETFYQIIRDQQIGLRLTEILRLERKLAGLAPEPCALRPTEFQNYRLNLLLDILDAKYGSGRGMLATYDLAQAVIYPGMMIGRGAEWKASSQRRRTQRLIEEAEGLMNGGYKRLLQGAPWQLSRSLSGRR